eukprot:scaffold3418_cov155-Skeletonema_marinoi.AAC.4
MQPRSRSILDRLSHPLKLTADEGVLSNSSSISDLIGLVLTENKVYKVTIAHSIDSFDDIASVLSTETAIDRDLINPNPTYIPPQQNDTVHSTVEVDSGQWTVHSAQCTVHSAQWTVDSGQWTGTCVA